MMSACFAFPVYFWLRVIESGPRMGRLMLAGMTATTFAAIGDRFSGQRSLRLLAQQTGPMRLLAQQPGPMGGEVCELIRKRDPNHPLLR